MTEQLLDDAQVGPAFKEMGGRAVPQPVRAHIGRAVHRGDGLVHHRSGLAHVEPPAPRAQQQRRPGLRGHQRGTPIGQPGRSASAAGNPNGAVRCLLPLPRTRTKPIPGIDVVDVQAA